MDDLQALSALPRDLSALKRPALVQLCKRWDVKAVGKNTNLVDRLIKAHAAQTKKQQVCGVNKITLESGTDTSQASISAAALKRLSNLKSPSPSDMIEGQQLTHEADCTMPGAFVLATSEHKAFPGERQRSVTPKIGRFYAVDNNSSVISAVDGSASMRRFASLPRKTLTPASSASSTSRLYPSLSLLKQPKEAAKITTQASSPVGAVSGRSPCAVHPFTFSCLPQFAPTSPSSTAWAASASVLAALNARLASSGLPPAIRPAPASVSTFNFSPSTSSLVRTNGRSLLPATKVRKKFDRAHQMHWSKSGSIAEHWSLQGRHGKNRLSSTLRADTRINSDGSHKKTKIETVASHLLSGSMGAIAGQYSATQTGALGPSQVSLETSTCQVWPASAAAATIPESDVVSPSRVHAKKLRSSLGAAKVSKGMIKSRKPPLKLRGATNARLEHDTPLHSKAALHGDARGSSQLGKLPLMVRKGNDIALREQGELRPLPVPVLKSYAAVSPSACHHASAKPVPGQPAAKSLPATEAVKNARRVLETKRRAAEESRLRVVQARLGTSIGPALPGKVC